MDKHFSRKYNGTMIIITCVSGISYVDVHVNTLSVRLVFNVFRHTGLSTMATLSFATYF